MKTILEFNLPEDKEQMKLAQKGSELFFLIQELDQDLRELQKYKDQSLVEIQQVRRMIVEKLMEIDIPDLYGYIS